MGEREFVFDCTKERLNSYLSSSTSSIEEDTVSENLHVKEEKNMAAVIKHNYEAKKSGEISLVEGTHVLVLEKSSGGHWKGEYNGQVCWFQSVCVEEEKGCHNFLEKRGVNCNLHAVAIYSYTPQHRLDLRFKEGEHLEIINNEKDWWTARNKQGEVGLVPRSFVEVIEVADTNLTETGPSTIAGNTLDFEGSEKDVARQCTSKQGASGRTKDETEKTDLSGKVWFLPNVSRHQCEELLKDAEDGTFVVRESQSDVGEYSISVRVPAKVLHFKVSVEDGTYKAGRRKFETLDELVENYKRIPLTNYDGCPVYLIKPLQNLSQ